MKKFLLPLCLLPCLAAAQIEYSMKTLPATQQIAVTIKAETKGEKTGFFMPAWVPGFYVILHHEQTVSEVKATDGAGIPLRVEPQSNPREWVVDTPKPGRIVFTYKVKGNDPGLGFFGVNVRQNTAFVLGGAAFMYVEGRKSEPATLTITNPPGWDIGTSMNKDANGIYHGRDYDEFIDHPIDLGHFVKRTFTAEGHPFEVDFVTTDELYPQAAADQFAARIKKLVVPAMRMYGKAPFDRYVFHLHFAVGNFSGGLEHQASVTIAVAPQARPEAVDDLFTHEFFHAWNVKNIRPFVLGPFDYTREVRTDNLWFAEGVTDYYAKVLAYRSGLDGINDYLFPAFSGEINTYQSGRTRLTKTLADASQGAWEGFSEGTGDLSYYNKGQLVGWILDSQIRKVTNGQKSLDDVMRYMYEQYHLPDKPGYPENGILLAINQVSGHDFSELYHKLVYTTDDLPYQLLEDIGIRFEQPDDVYQELGFEMNDQGVVEDLEEDIFNEGLRKGDRVLAFNGVPFTGAVSGLSPQGYTVKISRGGVELTKQLTPLTQRAEAYAVKADPFATPEQAARLQQWLDRTGGVK